MGRSGGGHTVHWEVPNSAAAIKPRCVRHVCSGGWGGDGVRWDGARWGAVAGEWHGGREMEGWERDG